MMQINELIVWVVFVKEQTMLILGVDPGVVSGWALIGGNPPRPLDWGHAGKAGKKGYRGTGQHVKDVLERCGELCVGVWPPMLAIEGQFVANKAQKGGKDRAKAVRTLITARHAGIWIGVCQEHGLPVYEINGEPGIQPVTWRSAVWGGQWTTEQAKIHAVETVKNLWGIRILKTYHHTAEAIWIGMYAATELRVSK
jgi:Holliday junction resolvasome RuvABC endonuclease subunit